MIGMKFVIEVNGNETKPLPLDVFEARVEWYHNNGYDVYFDIGDGYPDYVTVYAIVSKKE